MEIRIFSAREYNAKLKCAIHSSGKLGFTDETAKELGLSVESGIKFAMNDKDELLLINCRLDKDEDAFDVSKSGTYYYVNAKPLFDSLGLDYKNNVIMFDLSKLKHDTLEIYKLNQRSKPRKAESDKKQWCREENKKQRTYKTAISYVQTKNLFAVAGKNKASPLVVI